MAVTVEQIFAEFPEFKRASHELVSAKLRDAEVLTARDYGAGVVPTPDDYPPDCGPYTPARDMRVKYLAAELLVLTPAGEFARLDPSREPDGARSIYERRRLELDRTFVALVSVL